ncbi:hypothetical protein [Luteimonas huabeiensis]|uniref:hypothetical protein n=1 Tax=Luteimonas huabeiensis TaxID=1244513 RepID=UPI0004645A41|nr:hypothetical protein [Luteimonas huabeiensis]
MNFAALKRRVERSEQVVDGRIAQTDTAWRGLDARWREAWTPPRILLAGLLAGFFTGKANPHTTLLRIGKLASPRTMQMVTSLSGLLASAQAAYAAFTAKGAADTADTAAQTADQAAETASEAVEETAAPAAAEHAGIHAARPPADRRRPDPTWERQPAPAEAATDVSER